ncbi:MAG TPA: hypothetical protein VMS11_13290, partial [Solirubrobacterales bacterium]|nr:hypothetical protein [Solirubrobacterales bacterium]
AKPVNPSTGVASGGGGTDTAPEETSASGQNAASSESTEPESHDDGSPAVAALLGIGAGALLFGAAWAARKGWMRWRYGL